MSFKSVCKLLKSLNYLNLYKFWEKMSKNLVKVMILEWRSTKDWLKSIQILKARIFASHKISQHLTIVKKSNKTSKKRNKWVVKEAVRIKSKDITNSIKNPTIKIIEIWIKHTKVLTTITMSQWMITIACINNLTLSSKVATSITISSNHIIITTMVE